MCKELGGGGGGVFIKKRIKKIVADVSNDHFDALYNDLI